MDNIVRGVLYYPCSMVLEPFYLWIYWICSSNTLSSPARNFWRKKFPQEPIFASWHLIVKIEKISASQKFPAIRYQILVCGWEGYYYKLFLTFFDADIVPCGSGSTPELWPSNLCSLTRYITLTLWLLFQIRRGNAWEISCYALMSRRRSTHIEKQSNYCTIIVDSLALMQYCRTGFNCENLIIANCELFANFWFANLFY